jgi:hypothetical protein
MMQQSQTFNDYRQAPPALGASASIPFISDSQLDNRRIQSMGLGMPESASKMSDWSSFEYLVLTILRSRFSQFAPQSKLNSLKRRRFPAQGRDARISASVTALDRHPVFPATTDWKRAAESAEYDEED